MIIVPSDIPIKSIVDLLEAKIYDLQPDFQRDIVWPLEKQQKLIDSIFRGWHIPPIHVVKIDGKKTYEILDGKQRLNSIYSFYKDDFAFNSNFLPEFDYFKEINRKKFSQLPQEFIHKYLFETKIRVLEVSDVKMDEATELFLRLNTGVIVSASEKRNCIYGPVKELLRDIIDNHPKLFSNDTLGFINLRMVYQDVLDRIYFLEKNGNLNNKPTTRALEKMYFEKNIDEKLKYNIINNISAMEEVLIDFYKLDNARLTKSTMISYYWLIRELINNNTYNCFKIRQFLNKFELWRMKQRERYEFNFDVDKKYLEFEAFLSEGWLDPFSLKGRHEILTNFYNDYYNKGEFGEES